MSAAKPHAIVRPILLIAGLVGAAIGTLMLAIPVEFHGTAGLTIGGDTSLLNELRAAGGGVLACGLFVLAGAVRAEMAFASAALAMLVYLGNGLGRVYSISVDGPPSEMLMAVAASEIAVGLACAFAFAKTLR